MERVPEPKGEVSRFKFLECYAFDNPGLVELSHAIGPGLCGALERDSFRGFRDPRILHVAPSGKNSFCLVGLVPVRGS